MSTTYTTSSYYRKQPAKKSSNVRILEDVIVIERNVPLPADSRRGSVSVSTRETINLMRSGDSIVVHSKSRLGTFASMFRVMEIKYVSRSLGDGTYRIWRA